MNYELSTLLSFSLISIIQMASPVVKGILVLDTDFTDEHGSAQWIPKRADGETGGYPEHTFMELCREIYWPF